VVPGKLKVKHNLPCVINNQATQYTQEDLVTLNDDIVEIKLDDNNIDMFNKESILLALTLISKKLKKLQNE
jgi:hypothetical protein